MKVNIIGGGIAGLTAGCYLQMHGFDSEIFESHSQPGGLCTSWKVGDYTVDGCLHWLVGSNPNDPVWQLWSEIIDMSSIDFHYPEEFFRVRDENGNEIIGYTDIQMLEAELLAKAPEDKDIIEEFVKAVKKLDKLKMGFDKAPELYSMMDKIREFKGYLPVLNILRKYSGITIGEFARKCRSPLLGKFFEYSFASEMPMLFIMITFSWLNRKNAGYPIGGSLKFSRMFEKKYLELGGKIHYGTKVVKILTEDKARAGHRGFMFQTKKPFIRAAGIVLEDGSIHESDITISAADGYSTIFNMLDGRFADNRVRRYFSDFSVFPSFLQISLGVNKTFDGIPSAVVIPQDGPCYIDPERTIDHLFYRIVNYDPTLAPKGKTLILCMVKTYNYRYWKELRDHDRQRYQSEKNRILEYFIERLDKELGGIRENLEMTDVSTPATWIRYTHNWKGSAEGWMITKETGFNSLPKVLPGLEDFYMAGQWVEPGGGVPAAFFSGRNVVQIIAKKHV